MPSFLQKITDFLTNLPQRAQHFVNNQFSPQDFLIFAAWVLGVMVFLWFVIKNRHRLKYNILLFFKGLTEGGMRRKVLSLLMSKGYEVDIYQVEGDRKIILCKSKLVNISGNTLHMKVLKNYRLDPSYKGRQLLCFHRPIIFLYWVFNSFTTYPTAIARHKDPTKMVLRLKLPLKIDTASRRVHSRERIKNQDLIKLRAWIRCGGEGAGDNFRFKKPDFQIGIETKDRVKAPGRIDNISSGGIRFSVHSESFEKQIQEKELICLELFMYNREAKDYDTFMMRSQIRSANIDSKGYLHIGCQFLSLGQMGDNERTLIWGEIDRDEGSHVMERAIERMRVGQVK